jgi:hypothetical protein
VKFIQSTVNFYDETIFRGFKRNKAAQGRLCQKNWNLTPIVLLGAFVALRYP